MPSLGKGCPQPRHGRQTAQASRSARFRAALSERFCAAVLELAIIVATCPVRRPYIKFPAPVVAGAALLNMPRHDFAVHHGWRHVLLAWLNTIRRGEADQADDEQDQRAKKHPRPRPLCPIRSIIAIDAVSHAPGSVREGFATLVETQAIVETRMALYQQTSE